MRRRPPRVPAGPAAAGLLLLAALGGCDDVAVGRAVDDGVGVRLLKLLVEDPESGRIVDLLDDSVPSPCAYDRPCPAGTPGLAAACVPTLGSDGQPAPGGAGVCVSPAHAGQRVPVGAPGSPGSIELRLVLSRTLDVDRIEETLVPDGGSVNQRRYRLLEPGAFGLFDGGGAAAEVGSVKWYDPAGSLDSLDPLAEPLGPALVIAVMAPLQVGRSYAVRIEPGHLVDVHGNPLTAADGGPLPPAGYAFTTDELQLEGAAPPVLAAAATVGAGQVVTLRTNAAVDEASLRATLIEGSLGDLSLRAWSDRGADPTACRAARDPATIDLYPVDPAGRPAAWPAGPLAIALAASAVDNPGSTLATTVRFTVAGSGPGPADPQAQALHLLPSQCL